MHIRFKTEHHQLTVHSSPVKKQNVLLQHCIQSMLVRHVLKIRKSNNNERNSPFLDLDFV